MMHERDLPALQVDTKKLFKDFHARSASTGGRALFAHIVAAFLSQRSVPAFMALEDVTHGMAAKAENLAWFHLGELQGGGFLTVDLDRGSIACDVDRWLVKGGVPDA